MRTRRHTLATSITKGRPIALSAAANNPGGGWPGLCFDNTEAREPAEEFLRAVVGRYQPHPALKVWDVWNEPHLEPSSYFPERFYCYCGGSLAAFRDWLEARYESVGAINEAWSRRYADFGEVQPPRMLDTYPDFLDWREFWLENLRSWLKWKADIVRSIDSTHLTMTHVASSAYLGTLTSNVSDEWLLAEPVDLFGASSFPRWLMNDDPVIHLFHLEMTRDAAGGKPFWQAELQGGRGRRQGTASTPHPTPESLKSWIWHNLAIGSKGVVFWQWRSELLGPESPGYGLCAPSGESTDRSEAAAEMAALIASFNDLAESRPVAPSVGIVVSRKTPLLAYASEGSMQLYADSLLGSYRAFLTNNIAVEFVHEDRIALGVVPATITSLYFPMPSYVADATARALSAFVRGGGVLVAEAGPGAYVEHGRFAAQVPSHGLRHVFGADVIESDVADEIEIDVNGRRVLGAWGVDRLRPRDAAVVGSFYDGSAAVVENLFGRGRAVLIASYPSLAYERTRDFDTAAWMVNTAAGSTRETRAPRLLTRWHEVADRSIFFALNVSDCPVHDVMPSLPPLETSAGLAFTEGFLAIDLPPRDAALAVFSAT